MTITDKRLELFREKIKTYDKDGGFIVYVEDEDNQDFDVELIEKFLSTSIQQAIAEERERVRGEIEKMKKETREDFYFDIETENRDFIYDYAEKLGYNKAIDDLKPIISNITRIR